MTEKIIIGFLLLITFLMMYLSWNVIHTDTRLFLYDLPWNKMGDVLMTSSFALLNVLNLSNFILFKLKHM